MKHKIDENQKVTLTLGQLKRPIEEGMSKRDFERTVLCWMSTRRQSKTGLPMTIWIDDSKTYINVGHYKIIKFQLDKGAANPDNFGVMDLAGKILKPDRRQIRGLSEKELNELRHFVHNNKYVLERVADMELDMDDIWPHMIMGGDIASEDQIKALNAKAKEMELKPASDEQAVGTEPTNHTATKKPVVKSRHGAKHK